MQLKVLCQLLMPVTHRSGNTSTTQLTLVQVSGEFVSMVCLCS